MKKQLLTIALLTLVTNSLFANFAPSELNPNSNVIIIEDAEDGKIDGWTSYTTIKGKIKNIKDTSAHSRVIQLIGRGMKSGYSLSFPSLSKDYNIIEWKMKYSENYAIYCLVKTTNGIKYLRYSALEQDKGKHGMFISFGLGASSNDGKWHRFKRNLQDDLQKFEPNNTVLSIHAFMLRGSGLVDDIKVSKEILSSGEFDTKKFKELLEKKVNDIKKEFPQADVSLYDTEYERIKYINSYNQYSTFYTLSKNQKELTVIYSVISSSDEGSGYTLATLGYSSDYKKVVIGKMESGFIWDDFLDISSLPSIKKIKTNRYVVSDADDVYDNVYDLPSNIEGKLVRTSYFPISYIKYINKTTHQSWITFYALTPLKNNSDNEKPKEIYTFKSKGVESLEVTNISFEGAYATIKIEVTHNKKTKEVKEFSI